MSASSMKIIKNRIKSVQGTMQITKAMELVATSKMRKASERIESARIYFDILREAIEDITKDNKDFSSVFTQKRSGKTCRVVIAGDRGLAGGYNHNLLKSVETDSNDIIFPIGVKAREYFSDYDIYSDKYVKAGDVEMSDCREIGRLLARGYEKGDFTSVSLSYTSFVNMLVQRPESVEILPLRVRNTDSGPKNVNYSLIIYEPDAETVFEKIIPHYISGMIYGAVCHSVASELSARRNAMEAANDNASEMIDKLRLEYNSARQASITQELTKKTAGVENL